MAAAVPMVQQRDRDRAVAVEVAAAVPTCVLRTQQIPPSATAAAAAAAAAGPVEVVPTRWTDLRLLHAGLARDSRDSNLIRWACSSAHLAEIQGREEAEAAMARLEQGSKHHCLC